MSFLIGSVPFLHPQRLTQFLHCRCICLQGNEIQRFPLADDVRHSLAAFLAAFLVSISSMGALFTKGISSAYWGGMKSCSTTKVHTVVD